MIHLAVGRLELDWGKNHGFQDHSHLFQITDTKDVPYYYGGSGPDDVIVEMKEGLSKPLTEVVDRLELLGHTYAQVDKEIEYVSALAGHEVSSFGLVEMQALLSAIDVEAMSADYGEGGEDFGKFFRRELAPKLDVFKFAKKAKDLDIYAMSQAMENLSAYALLQMLSKNPEARNLPVNWQFLDLEEAGWGARDTFVRRLDPAHRFLIVTEGSSDSAVIRHAFGILRPHIADFFDFVDMEEGYPFSGTGNVYKFVQGLVSIGVQNNVLVLFDNDAEGVFNFNRCKALNLPKNMEVLKLPDIDAFTDFPTVGPNGEGRADINSRAAAIECYLQLDSSARVRWTSYQKSLDSYQGELERKTDYMREFLALKDRTAHIDHSKIEAVLSCLVSSAVRMKEREVEQIWHG
jgi:HEPN/Toprim N-terminal domain 1